MSFSYEVDVNNARSNDNVAPRITDTGAYIGTFNDAYFTQTRTGAGFIHFEFVEKKEGRSCRLSLCILKKNGEYTFNKPILDALLTVMRVGKLAGNRVEKKTKNGSQYVERFEVLLGQPVGLLLQKVYDENNERFPVSMNLVTPFDPKTGMVAAELLDQKAGKEVTARKLKERIANTKDRTIPLKAGSAAPVTSTASTAYTDNVPERVTNYFDDDQPF